MNTVTLAPGNRDNRTVTVGLFRSSRKGEILLIYLNDGEADATIRLYDQLSGKDRHLVRASAQDPMRLLKCRKTKRETARWMA